MIESWLVFGAVLGLLALGCGLALEAACGRRLPGELLPAAGLATLIALGAGTASFDVTAELTAPVVIGVALVGFAFAARVRRPLRPDPWLLGAAVAAGAIYGAPVIASGEPTFAGYLRLDDTATWLALTDRIMEAGRSLEGLAPSSYEATLAFNLGDGYPIGGFVPLGIGAALTGADPAWLVQPYLSLLAVLLVPVLAWLVSPIVSLRPARAAVGALAAQPALLVGFAQWGGIKEVLAALLVALGVALAVLLTRSAGGISLHRNGRFRLMLPLAATCAATVAALSAGGLIWLLPPLVGALVIAWRRLGRAEANLRAASLAVLAGLLALPVTLGAGSILPPTSSPLTSGSAQGNLFAPLGAERLAGVWPAGDFRGAAVSPLLADVLVWIVLGAAAVGLFGAWRRRAAGFALYVGGVLLACAILLALGSPWVGAKALATASPALPLAALAGALGFLTDRRRIPAGRAVRLGAALAVVAVAGGIVWSNALAYRDANLAPYDQLAELEAIGEMVAGEGPTLMTEYQPYGVRHFLRDGDPEGISELRRRQIPLRSGDTVPKGATADTDEISPDALAVYRTLVLRRSPAQSRPPSSYELAWQGRHYEVWQRGHETPEPPARLALGDEEDPTAILRCGDLAELSVEPGASILAARRPPTVAVHFDSVARSGGWIERGSAAIPLGDGVIRSEVGLPGTARWSVWLAGSVRGGVELRIDGRQVGSVRHFLNNQGQFVPLGGASLRRGRHRLELRHEGAGLEPGSGGRTEPVGPLVFSATDPAEARLVRVAPTRSRKLCGRRWDWVEAS